MPCKAKPRKKTDSGAFELNSTVSLFPMNVGDDRKYKPQLKTKRSVDVIKLLQPISFIKCCMKF